jgi:tetratricopeptide (TPR) repeat protein
VPFDITTMIFDPENKIVQLCARGMSMEAEGNTSNAAELFFQAWVESTNDLERFMSAHYVARHQKTIADKLNWDKTALRSALKIKDDTMKAHYPSLYLNIAKCYEDLEDFDAAKKQYQKALSYVDFLPNDGYGKMIKSGINSGIERVSGI